MHQAGARAPCMGQDARPPLAWPPLLPPRLAAYLTVADEAYGRAIPSEFLNRMQQAFSEKYADKGVDAKEGQLNSSFG